ncbi:MAG: cysteine desulfurase NifS [Anaerovoracaceae bacterium]|nr:cysteine desulfurase NifS [Anaerovoracaceae bacterium]
MKQIYLDYSATTPVKEEVVREMIPYYTEFYGNPSSLYSVGLEAKSGLETARSRVAELINAQPAEIRFTSCGTEADNWVLEGVADALKEKGNHIITSSIEHHAVLHTCQYLEKHGFEVTYLDVDEEGFVSPEALEAAIKDTTILVSIMMVNNEVGTVEPIKELAAVAKAHNILFHTDAVQALGNVPIDVKELGVDFMSMSAHKIYGPKGVGALYIKRGSRISSYMHGGAQEAKKRAGTENMAGIVGFGKAAQLAMENLDSHISHCTLLRDRLWAKISEAIPDVQLNGSKDKRHPGNLNVSFDYIEGEAILLMLDANGICVSTGSACSSNSLAPSHVLDALGVPVTKMNGTIRFTVGDFTTDEDIDKVVEVLAAIVARLREMSPVTGKEGW